MIFALGDPPFNVVCNLNVGVLRPRRDQLDELPHDHHRMLAELQEHSLAL